MRPANNRGRIKLSDTKMDHNPDSTTICNGPCNLPCEQIYLVHDTNPSEITASDANVTVSFTATNISNKDINTPLMLVSSLLGNLMFSQTGLKIGESKSFVRTIPVSGITAQNKIITNVTYMAHMGDNMVPGERLSKVVVSTMINKQAPSYDLYEQQRPPIIINTNIYHVSEMSIILVDIQTGNGADVLGIDIPLDTCACTLDFIRNPDLIFQINNNHLYLNPGKMLHPNMKYGVILEGKMNNGITQLVYTAASANTVVNNLIAPVKYV